MKVMSRLVPPVLLAMLIPAALFAQERPQKPPQQPAMDPQRSNKPKALNPPSGPSFYISPVEGSAASFSVLLGDGTGNAVAGTFSVKQLEIFEAVLEAAKSFAFTDEKVGSGSPITTRLMEQHEWSLFVDVSKIGDKSSFYISLVTPQGKLTAPAGEITRNSKKEQSAMLLDALAKVKDAKVGAQPSN